ncbi:MULTISPECIES: response regulator transcription factor [Hydrogenophaga]|uniref:Transcriptional regulator n=1 Tax=Hydrogenophaga electricum TaxID=1230953 RepID=A0ABQ6C4I5_9BURK|nr:MULTISPECIES: response regulator transcription factor [Hydrogenophaga]GLS14855.1 transcriptional regulator [Hydrogenophaga electricum]
MWDVVVCEDFVNLRDALVEYLAETGYWRVRSVSSGQALRQQLVERVPHVLLLDVGLPHESGIDIARWVKATHPGIGIVMLSGRFSPSDRLLGWRAGADAYLLKPAEMEEVELALKSVATRMAAAQPAGTQPAQIARLDVAKGLLTGADGHSSRLTTRETMLLHVLAMSNGTVVENDTLRRLLWADEDEEVDYHNALFSLVRRLRRKLETCGFPQETITGIRGRGYRLSATLQLDA